jgi:alpha-L-fucosidase
MTTRRDFLAATAAAVPLAHLTRLTAGRGRAALGPRPLPTPSQLAWQRDELAMFVHFGVNTFTDREWGDGTESPEIFAPTALDARQWARSAKAAGFRTMVLTAKHHDGFCLWPTATTRHSVAASPFRNGQGDVVREFVDASRAEGLKVGLYCSPWDRNSPAYGDSPRYNLQYWAQLTELLTRYGQVHEVWFDGANGEGPNGKRQVYDWPQTFSLVRKLQPEAVIFSDAGPDIRWIGNERGSAGDPNWSTIHPDAVPYPGVDAPGVIEALQHGHPDGTVWRPGETDTSIRPGWFYHPAEDRRVREVEELVELYFTSVGRNSKLLLNVPPTRTGLLHATDIQQLLEMRRRLDRLFADDLVAGHHPTWRLMSDRTAELTVDLGRLQRVGIVELAEPIESGQAVAKYRVEGHDGARWLLLASGGTIGYKKLDRITPTRVRRLRVTIDDAVEPPRPVRLVAYAG